MHRAFETIDHLRTFAFDEELDTSLTLINVSDTKFSPKKHHSRFRKLNFQKERMPKVG